jgi:hypothetical protein
MLGGVHGVPHPYWLENQERGSLSTSVLLMLGSHPKALEDTTGLLRNIAVRGRRSSLIRVL